MAEKEIRNPIIGMTVAEDEIQFRLIGEDGTKREFVFDFEPSLAAASEMVENGLEVMRYMQLVGFDQTLEDYALEEDTGKDPDGPDLDDNTLDKRDDLT